MAVCPFAVKKLIAPGANDPRLDEVYGGIAHVAVYEGDSLHDYFKYRSGGIESHFYIRYDGTIEQYRDTQYEADANHKANSFRTDDGKLAGFVSIETAGMGEGEWTRAQLASMKRLLVWLSETHDFPLVKCAGPFRRGVGYHTMWGAPSAWTPVAKSCPGPDRIKQFNNDLVEWMKTRRRTQARAQAKPKRTSRVKQATALLKQARDLLKDARDKNGRKHLNDNIKSTKANIRDLPDA